MRFPKRTVILAVGLVVALAPSVGCEFLRKSTGTQTAPPADGAPLQDRQANQFVTYLNQQAALLKTVRYDSVSMSASGPEGSIPRLTEGTLACASPRYFRLMSGHWATSGSEVDIGSNPTEFWMYVKRPEQVFVFCSHDDFSRGAAKLPVPFEPDWVLEALGMMTYDPALNYTSDMDQRNRVYTLAFDTKTPQGEPIRKAVVFAGSRAGGDRPQVLKHVVMTPTGHVIASAEVKEVKTVAAGTGAVQVPTRVTLEWPPQKFKMDLTLGKVQVNETIPQNEFAFFFQRPDIRGATPVNLANARFQPSSYRGSTPDDRRPRLFGGK
ncbi:MAG: hypothetical protein ACRC7O_06810 [Fimbriiglobus sp.]